MHHQECPFKGALLSAYLIIQAHLKVAESRVLLELIESDMHYTWVVGGAPDS